MAILKNAIICSHCGEEIVSTHVHHFITHSCKGMKEGSYIAADGGREYLRRVGNPVDWIEASVYDEAPDYNGHSLR